jgi:hypothetical protein
MGTFRDNGFVLRCFDVEEAFENICGVIMTDRLTGRIEIPVHIIRDQNGLDEMVVLAMVAMQLWRTDSQFAEESTEPAAAPLSRSSSSSSSSSARSDKKKKKGLFKKLKKLG